MNQTWEYGKKPNFGPNFGLFDPNLGRFFFFFFFFATFTFNISYTLLQAIILYNLKNR